VKSVVGEFSSGVSIYRNQHTRSDLGARFLSGPPLAGGYGGPFLRLWDCSRCILPNIM